MGWAPDGREKQIRALAVGAAATTSVWAVFSVVGIVRHPAQAWGFVVYGVLALLVASSVARRAWSPARKTWDTCLWLNAAYTIKSLDNRTHTIGQFLIAVGIVSLILALVGQNLDIRKVAVSADGAARPR
jgi:hypothetical protein